MNLYTYISDAHTEWIKDSSINDYTKLKNEFKKNNIKNLKLIDDTLFIDNFTENKKNILLIGSQHGTENSGPWTILDIFKYNALVKFSALPCLDIDSFETATRDISNKEKNIISKIPYNFDLIISFHEDHNMSKNNKYYMYLLKNTYNKNEIDMLKFDICNKLNMYPENRLTYNTNIKGFFWNKFNEFAEEKFYTKNNTFIRTEISSEMPLENRININKKLLYSIMKYFNYE